LGGQNAAEFANLYPNSPEFGPRIRQNFGVLESVEEKPSMRSRCARLPLVAFTLLAAAAGIGTSLAAEHEYLSPGLHDLVVYDAGSHELGIPGVNFKDDDGGLAVDIPPAVHVHRYYYSGDKEIQGPIVSGGPVIVVARHPKTGQQMYVDVVLPAGAPRIAYDGDSITYVYPDERVVVHFQHWPLDPTKAVVKYHKGQGIGRVIYAKRQKTRQHVHEALHESALVKSVKETAKGAGQLGLGTHEAAVHFTSSGVDFLKSAVGMVPGVTTLKSLAEQRSERQYSTSIQQAATRQAHQAPDFLRTNR
jgi:hypothetical protein